MTEKGTALGLAAEAPPPTPEPAAMQWGQVKEKAVVDLADIDESPPPPDVLAAGDLLEQDNGDEDIL